MFKKLKYEVTKKASEINDFSYKLEKINNSNYKFFFDQGIFYFNNFLNSTKVENDYDNLNLSAKYFTKAIEIKKNEAEAYFYLSYIFYFIEELDLAKNYLKIAYYLKPDLKGLEELKVNIFNKSIKRF
ncbi:MAG: hypothetical protein U0457_17735 [Candidatus Sericytochromatia bacterium]